jgi:hypothetical protein
VLLEWDKDGNFAIDATGAAKPGLDTSGKEQSNSGTAGKVTIKTKDGLGAESSIALDQQGGIKLTDGGGDVLEFIKAAMAIKATAGMLFELTAPTTKVTAAATLQATSPAMTFIAAGTFQVTCPVVILGAPPPVSTPLVKHTPWVSPWSDLLSELSDQVKTYTGPPAPPPSAKSEDYLKLLTKLQAVATAFPPTQTLLVKGA